jgi:hypothetical protein
MRWLFATVCPSPGGASYLIVAVDNRGDLYYLDTGDPAQRWKPLPPHPGKPSSSGGTVP